MKAFYRLFYYISIVLTSILAGVTTVSYTHLTLPTN